MTDGWLPLIEQDPVPVYFKKDDAIVNGRLTLSLAKIKSQNVPLEPAVPYVHFANVRGVDFDHFVKLFDSTFSQRMHFRK